MDNLPAAHTFVTVGSSELVYEVLGHHGDRVWIYNGDDYRTVDKVFLRPVAARN